MSAPFDHFRRLTRDRQGGINLPLILGILNSVLFLVALGTLVYTKVLFKRPPITEQGERQKLTAQKAKHTATSASGIVQFEPFTVNIKATSKVSLPAEGSATQGQEKTHFARIAMALELRDLGRKSKLDDFRPKVMDELLTLLGNKGYNEITTVQGRYVLRNDILEKVNSILKEPLVMNVFFNEFVVQ